MTAFVNRLGDRILGRLLPQVDAGACHPNYRKHCGCSGSCPTANEHLYDRNGICRRTSLHCVNC